MSEPVKQESALLRGSYDDRLRERLAKSDSENLANSYFKSTKPVNVLNKYKTDAKRESPSVFQPIIYIFRNKILFSVKNSDIRRSCQWCRLHGCTVRKSSIGEEACSIGSSEPEISQFNLACSVISSCVSGCFVSIFQSIKHHLTISFNKNSKRDITTGIGNIGQRLVSISWKKREEFEPDWSSIHSFFPRFFQCDQLTKIVWKLPLCVQYAGKKW